MGYSPWGCKESDMTHEFTHRQALPAAFLLEGSLEIPSTLATVGFFAKVKSPLPF